MKTAIFILGMHRSGTSALGGTLDLMGLEFGSDLMAANEDNPKGYFENNFVYKLNEKILKESSSAWDDYRFDASMIDKTKKELYKKEAKEIIENEFRYATNFAIKDPRICLLFPFWEEVCRELDIAVKIIIPYRNPIEVAASLKKRNKFSYEKSLILWSKHFLSAEYLTRKYERIFTSFDELITDTENVVKLLENFTGMKAPQSTLEKIKNDFLDSSVKHNNISLSNFTEDTPLFLQKILHLIKEKTFKEEKFDEIRKDFLFSLEFFQHKEIFTTIDNLRHENSLLEKVKDITKVDPEYYWTKYQDVKNAKVDPLKHFASSGQKEGRYPNYYCEYHKFSVAEISSVGVKAYLCEQEVENKVKELEQKEQKIQEIESQKAQLQESYNQKLQEIET
ncbi:MAG: sulfotransferase domain-containing protein, partial [Campylobacterales bacterium]|nr:sulfotransferase domain-containing protein [Campylobacterales bacterium]